MLTASQGKNRKAAILFLITVLCGCSLAFIQCSDSPTGIVPSSMTDPDSAFQIRIVHDEASSLGWMEFVDVTIDHLPDGFLTFFLEIEVDWSLADSMRLIPGEIFGDDKEALTYEIDNVSNDGMAAVRVQPTASRMSLGNRSDLLPYGTDNEGPVVLFTIVISPRREILDEWQWHPIRFNWGSCGSNRMIFASRENSDSIVAACSRHVYSTDARPPSPIYDISEPSQFFGTRNGAPQICREQGYQPRIDFYNGGVMTADASVFNDGVCIGDVNLDGRGADIEDVTRMAAALAYGDPILHHLDSREAADINRDGLCFTPSDLVYLVNITQDMPGYPLSRFEVDTADYTHDRGTLRVRQEVASYYAVFNGDVQVNSLVSQASGHFDGDSTRLFYVGKFRHPVSTASGPLLTAPRPPDRLEFSSPEGAHIVARRVWE